MLIALVLGYHLQNFFSELRATAPLHTAQLGNHCPGPTQCPALLHRPWWLSCILHTVTQAGFLPRRFQLQVGSGAARSPRCTPCSEGHSEPSPGNHSPAIPKVAAGAFISHLLHTALLLISRVPGEDCFLWGDTC